MRLVVKIDDADLTKVRADFDAYFGRLPRAVDNAIRDVGYRMVNVVLAIFMHSDRHDTIRDPETGQSVGETQATLEGAGYPEYVIDWMDLSARTLRRRRARGFSGTQPLYVTGSLMKSFLHGLRLTKQGSLRKASISSPDKRVPTLFLGYPRGMDDTEQKIPGRPMLPTGSEEGDQGYRLAGVLVSRAIIPLMQDEFERGETQNGQRSG